MNDDALRTSLHQAGYIADETLTTTLWLAGELQRPLMLEGDAGVGKTALAAALATALATGPVGAPVCDEAAAAPGANPRAASPGDDAGRSPCHPNTTTRPSSPTTRHHRRRSQRCSISRAAPPAPLAPRPPAGVTPPAIRPHARRAPPSCRPPRRWGQRHRVRQSWSAHAAPARARPSGPPARYGGYAGSGRPSAAPGRRARRPSHGSRLPCAASRT
mmetsp:Transcript_1104/g.3021  ORF Transcript_1104/g.3021 Transcript_1104/m.3021 type:complete len:217 (+) Transcript_1104:160-810(+)